MNISKESAHCKHHYLQAVGSDGRIRVSEGVSTFQAQSLTNCGMPMAASASARRSASTITYSLLEGNRRTSISEEVCTLHPQSPTFCGKRMAGSALVGRFALCKHNHLHPVGREWQDQHQHQQEALHFAGTFTYSLWEGNGNISVGKGVCTLQTQSLTGCRKAMAGSTSSGGFALCKHNHLQAVGSQWEDQYWQECLHLQAQSLTGCRKAIGGSASERGSTLASTITYILWEGNDRISINKLVCTLQAQSLTGCEKAMGASASTRVCTLQAQSHTPCGKAMAASASARGLHFTSTITYSLWEVNGRVSISERSALCKHNHILAVERQWQGQHQQADVHFANTITYLLW